MTFNDTISAFVPRSLIDRQDKLYGPLAGRTFGVSDNFDIEGLVTQQVPRPDLSRPDAPTRTATCIEKLLGAGGRLVGKTHCDMLKWELGSESVPHYAPINIAAPGRTPGAACSGHAAATAAGLTNFSVGLDAGGNICVSASSCGLYGIKTSRGLVSRDGARPIAPSFDTIGWFAQDAVLLAQVGTVLLQGIRDFKFNRVVLATDLFEFIGEPAAIALGPSLDAVQSHFPRVDTVDLSKDDRTAWYDAVRHLLESDSGKMFGLCATATPNAVKAARSNKGRIKSARRTLQEIEAFIASLLLDDAILVMPAAPGIPPLASSRSELLMDFQSRALELYSPIVNFPQVAVPAGYVDGCPIGLLLVGPQNSDQSLLELAVDIG